MMPNTLMCYNCIHLKESLPGVACEWLSSQLRTKKSSRLEVNQDLPWSNTNNVAPPLTGGDETDNDRYLIKMLFFIEEWLDKFIRQGDTSQPETQPPAIQQPHPQSVESLEGLKARDPVIQSPDTSGEKLRAIHRAWMP